MAGGGSCQESAHFICSCRRYCICAAELTVFGLVSRLIARNTYPYSTLGERSLQTVNNYSARRLTMAAKFSAEEVIGLLEEEMEEEIEEEIEEPMCEGSDDDLGMFQETEDESK